MLDMTGRARFALFVFLFSANLLFPVIKDTHADPRMPEIPAAPKVDLDETRRALGDYRYRASLVNARGEKKAGLLALKEDFIDADITERGPSEIRRIKISGIDVIEFIKWKGTAAKGNGFLFYPSEIKITLTDKSALKSRSDIKALNRLVLSEGNKSYIMYSCFYDYRENDIWRNTGEADISYPETNPHGDTVVRIVFSR